MSKQVVDPDMCNAAGCVVDEPGQLVERTLREADFHAVYCIRHDPLDDPEIAGLWQRPAEGKQVLLTDD